MNIAFFSTTGSTIAVNFLAKSILFIMLFLGTTMQANAQNLVRNGNFAQPSIPQGSFRILPREDAGFAWQSRDQKVEIWNVFNNVSGVYVAGIAEQQHLELDANFHGKIYQDLETEGGEYYEWRFWHRGRLGEDVVRVSINAVGTLIRKNVFGGRTTGIDPLIFTQEYTTGKDKWVQYVGRFRARNATTRITFETVATTGGRGIGNFLDHISVTKVNDNLVVNGDFLDPFINERRYLYVDDDEILGWHAISAITGRQNMEIQNITPNPNSKRFPVDNQYAEIDLQTTFFQEVATTAGVKYEWGLWHRGRAGTDEVEVEISAARNNVALDKQKIVTGTQWTRYSGTFTASDRRTLIRIKAVNAANNHPSIGNLIDDVSIKAVDAVDIGNFEQPSLGTSVGKVFAGPVQGWNGRDSNGENNIRIRDFDSRFFDKQFSSATNEQHVVLGYRRELWRNVATVPGESYRLTFYQRARIDDGNVAQVRVQIADLANNNTLTSREASSGLRWTKQDVQFVAQSHGSRINIRGLRNLSGLDEFSLTRLSHSNVDSPTVTIKSGRPALQFFLPQIIDGFSCWSYDASKPADISLSKERCDGRKQQQRFTFLPSSWNGEPTYLLRVGSENNSNRCVSLEHVVPGYSIVATRNCDASKIAQQFDVNLVAFGISHSIRSLNAESVYGECFRIDDRGPFFVTELRPYCGRNAYIIIE